MHSYSQLKREDDRRNRFWRFWGPVSMAGFWMLAGYVLLKAAGG